MTQEVTVMQKIRNRARSYVYDCDHKDLNEINEYIDTSMNVYKFFDIDIACGYSSFEIAAAWSRFINEFLRERYPEHFEPLTRARKEIEELLRRPHNPVDGRTLEQCFGILIDALKENEK